MQNTDISGVEHLTDVSKTIKIDDFKGHEFETFKIEYEQDNEVQIPKILHNKRNWKKLELI